MEKKRISVFIGRTIFFTSEENRFVICSQHDRRVGEEAKGYLAFMSKRRRVSSLKNMKQKEEQL